MLTKEQIADIYFGFMESSGNLVKYKARKTLDKVIRYNGELLDRKQFIFTRLQIGYAPAVREASKMEFLIQKDEFSQEHNCDFTSTFKVTKTEYDYANHLIASGLLNDGEALKYIQNERDNIRQNELAAIETERLKQEQAENEKAEAERFRKWLEAEAKNYNDTSKINLQKKIYLDILGVCNPNMRNLLVLIDNIDDPLCKEALKGMLRPDNTASRTAFRHITGVSLGKTKREMESVIDGLLSGDYTGVKEYKSVKSNEKLELFYIRHQDGSFMEVMAEPVNVGGLNSSFGKARVSVMFQRQRQGLSSRTATHAKTR